MKSFILNLFTMLLVVSLFIACTKMDDSSEMQNSNITIENVLNSKPLVQSGTFEGTGTAPVIFPGQSVSFSFYAGKNQAITFATMYGWSNDLFFAPSNPGIKLYTDDGTPIVGDVSSQIKLWDNGTRVNQKPGKDVMQPGESEPTIRNIEEINGTDRYGNTYLPASQLMKVSLAYNGSSNFTLTITNNSEGTMNETPFSPGIWAISYVAGGNQLLPNPIYTDGQETANGLTNLAESGDNSVMSTYLTDLTGIFTPLSPVLVIVYNGSQNPFYEVDEYDRGEGLKELAQMGNAEVLAATLKQKSGVKAVYVLEDPANKVLLPRMNGEEGGKVSQQLNISAGDRIAVATMYGFSNDWFFATKGNGVDASEKGDISISLFDNGTAVDQFPGASITQFNLDGSPLEENNPIRSVPNPNSFTTLPATNEIIKVTLH
ncbi:spondin domain-containing protein [Sphingobacterium kitahiroshimense]|uniref:Spondin domain-containing protein n=1 Tax=Sphingobacterium kitahiroshimense TaxID=470446 RepID=A0ABV0BQT3_9SPHI